MIPFRLGHETAYGLKICERDAATNDVVSVLCRFCASFGREEKAGAKRKVTSNVQYYKRPFRTDHYTKHAKEAHPRRWELYCASSDEKKSTFFDETVPAVHRETIKSHFGKSHRVVHHFVNKEIVDVIIGEMLFQPDDLSDNITKERALVIFDNVVDSEEGKHESRSSKVKPNYSC